MQFPKSPSAFENESPVPDNEVECGEIWIPQKMLY